MYPVLIKPFKTPFLKIHFVFTYSCSACIFVHVQGDWQTQNINYFILLVLRPTMDTTIRLICERYILTQISEWIW